MNDKLRKVLNYKYNAQIQDALYKMQCFSDHELVIHHQLQGLLH